LAAEKRKRRKEKERSAKQATTRTPSSLIVQDSALLESQADSSSDVEEEDDGRAAAAMRLRGRAASPTGSDIQEEEQPVASTSKFTTSTSLWSDDVPTGIAAEDAIELDFNELNSVVPPIVVDPASVPRIGKFWGHDDRKEGEGRGQFSRRGSKSSATALMPSNPPRRQSYAPSSTTPLSRASSATGDHDVNARSASPAGSQGGWQEVSSKPARKVLNMSGLRPNSAFVKSSSNAQISREPAWTHDRFEERSSYDEVRETDFHY